jgi:hypothetical protein
VPAAVPRKSSSLVRAFTASRKPILCRKLVQDIVHVRLKYLSTASRETTEQKLAFHAALDGPAPSLSTLPLKSGQQDTCMYMSTRLRTHSQKKVAVYCTTAMHKPKLQDKANGLHSQWKNSLHSLHGRLKHQQCAATSQVKSAVRCPEVRQLLMARSQCILAMETPAGQHTRKGNESIIGI